MSAMSASSAAPAGLMPLSLIAEHKSAQPPPAVQSLPRSGSDKCGTPASIAKPTANGMEGPGPIPLVSQLPQTTTALPAMTELSSQHSTNPASVSDGVQPPASSLSYQAPHQNLVKPIETGTAQEGNGSSFTGSGGIGTSMLSGERRHTEETTVQHHHMSSTTTSTFSTMSSTTIEHSRSAITAQLLQLQPSQPGSHQTSPAVISPDTTNSSTTVGNIATSIPEVTAATAPVQPVTTSVTLLEESTTRVQESTSTTQVTLLESATLNRQTVQHSPPGESVPLLQTTATQQSGATGSKQSEPSPSVPPANLNSPPKSAQIQITQPNVGSGTNPTVTTTTHQSASSTSITTTASGQLPSTESTLKVATLPRQTSKRPSKNASSSAAASETSKKSTGGDTSKDKDSNVAGDKPRRKRLPTQPYQSPIPELNIIAKYKKMKELNEKDKVEKRPSNSTSDKLIVFYRNEFLAVRNAEGGFYVCQAMQNVYKSSSRIRIRWLSQQPDPSSDLYTPDFYDHTEFDCILTNLNLERVEKDKFRLPQAENRRTESILQRALDVERGVAPPPADDTLTETHPDGLDLSLYRNEEQLKKRKKNKKKIGRKRELSSGEEKRAGSSSTRRRVVASSTISASAVAKAKKAAAIKRTAAVKRVVQQAAAARKQASSAASSTGSNKKLIASTAVLSNRASPANTSTSKKETKVHSSSVLSKRKASVPPHGASGAPEKRSRRGNPVVVVQQNQSQSQTMSSSSAQGKTRGANVVSNNANNKHVTTSNSGVGGNAANANIGATAGSARRTLRNSK